MKNRIQAALALTAAAAALLLGACLQTEKAAGPSAPENRVQSAPMSRETDGKAELAVAASYSTCSGDICEAPKYGGCLENKCLYNGQRLRGEVWNQKCTTFKHDAYGNCIVSTYLKPTYKCGQSCYPMP